jgi:hypothetical protein
MENKVKSVNEVKSPIPVQLRKKLVSDLQSVTIHSDEAIKIIDEKIEKDNRRKYLKNLIMITKLRDGDIFWKFDEHGRFHSNLTNLKREIKKCCLEIDGEPILSLDIKTSQPFFLAQILKSEWLNNECPEIQKFISLVEGGDLYDHFLIRYPDLFKDRDAVKPMVFKSLFDTREYVHHYKELFKVEFPVVYEFIESYPIVFGEELWRTLQRMESELVFNKIYQTIINEIEGIRLFTVHDSIHFPERYYDRVKKIWDAALEELINK